MNMGQYNNRHVMKHVTLKFKKKFKQIHPVVLLESCQQVEKRVF